MELVRLTWGSCAAIGLCRRGVRVCAEAACNGSASTSAHANMQHSRVGHAPLPDTSLGLVVITRFYFGGREAAELFQPNPAALTG